MFVSESRGLQHKRLGTSPIFRVGCCQIETPNQKYKVATSAIVGACLLFSSTITTSSRLALKALSLNAMDKSLDDVSITANSTGELVSTEGR